MIVVTGTKRSGTSLWMQLLIAGGLPYIGQPFLGDWEDTIAPANPNGFFESQLRYGINFSNNPHPQTGNYLDPQRNVHRAIKIFASGLAKTEWAFLHRVVASMRPWNEYCASIRRLHAIERQRLEGNLNSRETQIKLLMRGADIHPAMVWWLDNYSLLVDVQRRAYPIRWWTFEQLLYNPNHVIGTTFEWIQSQIPNRLHRIWQHNLDVDHAVGLVQQQNRTQVNPEIVDHDLPPSVIDTFERLYTLVKEGQLTPSQADWDRFHQQHLYLQPIIQRQRSEWRRNLLGSLRGLGIDDGMAVKMIQRRIRKQAYRYDMRSPSPIKLELWDDSTMQVPLEE